MSSLKDIEPLASAGSAGAKPVPRPPNLVYAGSGHEVVTVMVAGVVLVRDGEVLATDEGIIRAEPSR